MTSSLSAFSSRRSGKPIWLIIYTLLLITLLSGCGTLPDAKPFADATNSLSIAVNASGQAVSDSLSDAGDVLPSNEQPAYEKNKTKLQEAWAVRVEAIQGAAIYADAMADLIAAGNEGGETAKRVGDSLGTLAAATGIPIAAPFTGVLGDIGRFLADRIAIVKASKTLEDAVAQAQPAIDRIAEQQDKDTTLLKSILKNVHGNIISGIKTQYEYDDNFAPVLNGKLTTLREALLKGLKDPIIDQKKISDLHELERMQEAVTTQLKERDQKIAQAASAYKVRLQLVNKLSTAITAWAAAHRDLANAIREKRKVSVTELQETVSDLKEIIKKVREL